MEPQDPATISLAGMMDTQAIQDLHRALCLEAQAEKYGQYDENWLASTEGSAYLNRRLAHEGIAIVATVRGCVVGYLLGGLRELDGEAAAGLESMYVVPAFRRRGIARALIERFLQWFDDSGVELASVAVVPANVAAAALYRATGFVDYRTIQGGATLILARRRKQEGRTAGEGSPPLTNQP